MSLAGLQNRRTQSELDLVHLDHEEIVDAVVRQEPDRAVRLMDRHVESAMHAIRRTLT